MTKKNENSIRISSLETSEGKQIEVKTKLSIFHKKSDDVNAYVTYCPVLKLYSQGDTLEEARKEMDDAIEFTLAHAISEKYIDKLLVEECGFEKISMEKRHTPTKRIFKQPSKPRTGWSKSRNHNEPLSLPAPSFA